MNTDEDHEAEAPRQTIFGSFIDFVRKDSKSEEPRTDRRGSHLSTWSNGIRHLVSKKKRRHKEDGFDLDLTYITPRIIAMGFPSTGNEGIYRNNASHVTEFLGNKHGEKVKVYNLCSERDYPKELFGGRVSKYPFDDHNPPPMPMFLPFCKDVEQWLDDDPENVVAIHCKAGKGRTGVMICAFLIYFKEWEDADESMQFYGFARTDNQKGVTIPSQRRFIRYFAELCRDDSEGIIPDDEGEEDGKVSGEVVTVGDNEGETLGAPPKGRARKQSIIGVDMEELKAQMAKAKAEMVSGDENESDSDDEKKKKTGQMVQHMESINLGHSDEVRRDEMVGRMMMNACWLLSSYVSND
jgi:protein-tyrosine phosphatase